MQYLANETGSAAPRRGVRYCVSLRASALASVRGTSLRAPLHTMSSTWPLGRLARLYPRDDVGERVRTFDARAASLVW